MRGATLNHIPIPPFRLVVLLPHLAVLDEEEVGLLQLCEHVEELGCAREVHWQLTATGRHLHLLQRGLGGQVLLRMSSAAHLWGGGSGAHRSFELRH